MQGPRGLALAALLALAPAAQALEPLIPGSRAGFSLGARAMDYRPSSAEKGSWSGGAQARLHFTPALCVEGSADYRQTRSDGALADIVPLQASLLLYLFPGVPLSPYLLGGAGWYYTRLRGPDPRTQNRWGPHAGAGLEMFMSRAWSLDGSYRRVWNGDIHTMDVSHPVGKDTGDSGSMYTIGLNYFFGGT